MYAIDLPVLKIDARHQGSAHGKASCRTPDAKPSIDSSAQEAIVWWLHVIRKSQSDMRLHEDIRTPGPPLY